MPKANHLPTDPMFPAFRDHVEMDYGGPLPDDAFYAAVQDPTEPYHTEPCKAFRLFKAGYNAAEALVERLTRELDETRERSLANNMLAYQWMVAHDARNEGRPYTYPTPADLPESEARALAAEARALAAEARAEALTRENEGLREAMLEASELDEGWGAYAGEYFQTKHDLEGDVSRLRALSQPPADEAAKGEG